MAPEMSSWDSLDSEVIYLLRGWPAWLCYSLVKFTWRVVGTEAAVPRVPLGTHS